MKKNIVLGLSIGMLVIATLILAKTENTTPSDSLSFSGQSETGEPQIESKHRQKDTNSKKIRNANELSDSSAGVIEEVDRDDPSAPTSAEITAEVTRLFQEISFPETLAKDPGERYQQLRPILEVVADFSHEIASGAVVADDETMDKYIQLVVALYKYHDERTLLSHVVEAYDGQRELFQRAVARSNEPTLKEIETAIQTILTATE